MEIDFDKNPLKIYMKKHKLNQKELSVKLDISKITLLKLLCDYPSSSFQLKTLKRISELSNINFNRLCNYYAQFL